MAEITKISELPLNIETTCEDKNHRPTKEQMEDPKLEPGKYQAVCPTCGKKVIWTVYEK